MMGWVMFLVVALLVALLLWLSGFPRRLWTVAATALMLAASGYAWQGRPGVEGNTVAAKRQGGEVDPGLVALRDSMFGRFNFEYQYFVAADALTRSGSPGGPAKVMLGAVRTAPKDGALWTWLGVVLAENDGNQLSPAAQLAFERAEALWPNHPGPAFFHGLALVRQGEFVKARPYWAEAVALTSEKAGFRDELVVRLFLLDKLLESQEAARAPAGAAAPAPAPPPVPAAPQ